MQYVIDQPMVEEPGKKFVYSSGVTQLLSHIFKQVTGKTVDEYAAEYVFKPLGMHYYWKHTPTGLPDTEGGLYLSTQDLAKIGALYLHDGEWNGQTDRFARMGEAIADAARAGGRRRLQVRIPVVAGAARETRKSWRGRRADLAGRVCW